jgi:TPP-dependent trihydroxycyclohexane-1,2-dione (THcHDO) dehydratase
MEQFELEQLSVEDARKLVRKARMNPEINRQLVAAVRTLLNQADQAFVLKLPEGVKFAAARTRLIRIANQMNVPLTIRKQSGGKAILFWMDQRPARGKSRRRSPAKEE